MSDLIGQLEPACAPVGARGSKEVGLKNNQPQKLVQIDELLRWTYCVELPKDQIGRRFLRPESFGQPWGSITKTGVLGTEVQEPDVRNYYGLVPDLSANSDPAGDAVRVFWVVQELDRLDLTVPDDWYPLSDLLLEGHHGPAAVTRALDRMTIWQIDGKRRLKRPVSYLVRKHAILGGTPGWQAEQPVLKTENYDHGQPKWFRRETKIGESGAYEVEIDGMDRKRNRPHPDAYRKWFYEPDPSIAAEDRAEYELWHAALSFLEDELRGRLDEFVLETFALPARPWEGEGAPPSARVLTDNTPKQPIVRLQRPLAGPPPKRGFRHKKRPKKRSESSGDRFWSPAVA